MAVKILIQRKVKSENIMELTSLLKKLRSLTINQEGYISGETLKRIDVPNECMVISTWRSVKDWDAWVQNEKRMAIQSEIDRLLDEKTQYAVYEE